MWPFLGTLPNEKLRSYDVYGFILDVIVVSAVILVIVVIAVILVLAIAVIVVISYKL